MGPLKTLARNGQAVVRQLARQLSLAESRPSLHKAEALGWNPQNHHMIHRPAGLVQRHLSNVSGPVALDTEDLVEAVQLPGSLPSFTARDIIINKTLHPKPFPSLSELKFGALFSDHMLTVAWSASDGWTRPSINPLAPLAMHPCAQVFHYGLECFEGMKAYRGADGRIRLFRPEKNMARLISSCKRLNLPVFDKEEFLECIKALLKEDRNWVPSPEGYSLYLRPTCIATTAHLSVGPPKDALLFVVMSPVGLYYPEGLKPIKLYVDTTNVRAFPGGVGDRKVGGNYGPTIQPQVAAAEKGCSQVLYVLDDGKDTSALIGESGAMNVFFLLKKEGAKGGRELVTPPLDGLILPGVTRASVLELAKSWGEFEVSERPIRLNELEEAHSSGRLEEMFGTGTAVVIQPISGLLLPDGRNLELSYNEAATSYWSSKPAGSSAHSPKLGEPFNVTGRVYRAILDIQYGHVPSSWSVPIDDAANSS